MSAYYRQELEERGLEGMPALEMLEAGRPIGAVIPMSLRAMNALRDSIELVDYLTRREFITWN
jgi:hypothetical protein